MKSYLVLLMKNNFVEITTTVALIGLSILLLNPLDFWMPNMMVVGMLVAVLLVFAIFASFILREKVRDERDQMHQSLAGRNAFLAGVSILLIGIAFEGMAHAVDPWLVTALVFMLIMKIVTRIWSDTHL